MHSLPLFSGGTVIESFPSKHALGLPSSVMEVPASSASSRTTDATVNFRQSCHHHSTHSRASTTSSHSPRFSHATTEMISSRGSSWRRSTFRGPPKLAFVILLLMAVFGSRSNQLVQAEILKIPKTEFTNFSETPNYISSTSYNARGMGPLYNLTNIAIRLFVDTDPVPEGECFVIRFICPLRSTCCGWPSNTMEEKKTRREIKLFMPDWNQNWAIVSEGG